MRYFGAIVVLAYAAISFTGFEPFSRDQRGPLPPDARRGPGGVLLWHSGFRGGK